MNTERSVSDHEILGLEGNLGGYLCKQDSSIQILTPTRRPQQEEPDIFDRWVSLQSAEKPILRFL